MEINRRTALKIYLSLVGSLALAPSLYARSHRPVFAAARRGRNGGFEAALFNHEGDIKSIALPGRGHDLAVHPDQGEVVVFAKRPGRFAIGFSVNQKKPPQTFFSNAGRHFYGHGVFSKDGRLLFTTENDYENGIGVIGVRDATNAYAFIGEFPSYGIGPHDLALVDDGGILVVANGGIETHPDMGRQILNSSEMEPSLVYIDTLTGDLLEKASLPLSLRQLSIRHLTVTNNNRVMFGCQFKGPAQQREQLIGFHDRGRDIAFTETPKDVLPYLKNYIGSVAVDHSGEIVAASAPRGNLITFWQSSNGRYLGMRKINDGCGIAKTNYGKGFLLTSGSGSLSEISLVDQRNSPFVFAENLKWDNHAVYVGGL